MLQIKQSKVNGLGDFQTPLSLAQDVVRLLTTMGIEPGSVIEPTCGKGAFIEAAQAGFPRAEYFLGVDINEQHLACAQNALAGDRRQQKVTFTQGDFFVVDWDRVLAGAPEPWLVTGNPPWVTSSEISSIGSFNLPKKSNFQGRDGIEAVTGKSNFDISEWMILKYLDWLRGRRGTIAILCKTAVARKILAEISRRGQCARSARIYGIDAKRHFNAAVDACLFVIEVGGRSTLGQCAVYDSIQGTVPIKFLGFDRGEIIADLPKFALRKSLGGGSYPYAWRSGVKHDSARVMELIATPEGYRNGFGELCDLEDALLYPLLKSSDLGNGRLQPTRRVLVTQRNVGEATSYIRDVAPRTWEYLENYANALDNRASVIYRGKHRFAMFGVGDYTFAPWKVAISGLYKRLDFYAVGPSGNKPVVFDDTVYFLPCSSRVEAEFVSDLLRSTPAREFYESLIFWSNKRPVTAEVLNKLSIRSVADELGRLSEYKAFASEEQPRLALDQPRKTAHA